MKGRLMLVIARFISWLGAHTLFALLFVAMPVIISNFFGIVAARRKAPFSIILTLRLIVFTFLYAAVSIFLFSARLSETFPAQCVFRAFDYYSPAIAFVALTFAIYNGLAPKFERFVSAPFVQTLQIFLLYIIHSYVWYYRMPGVF